MSHRSSCHGRLLVNYWITPISMDHPNDLRLVFCDGELKVASVNVNSDSFGIKLAVCLAVLMISLLLVSPIPNWATLLCSTVLLYLIAMLSRRRCVSFVPDDEIILTDKYLGLFTRLSKHRLGPEPYFHERAVRYDDSREYIISIETNGSSTVFLFQFSYETVSEDELLQWLKKFSEKISMWRTGAI